MFMFTIFTLPSDGGLTNLTLRLLCLCVVCHVPWSWSLVMVAAGLTESLICVIIIMRQLTTGDKKLCVFQYDNKIDKA